jgi:hypothetical protein
MNGGNFRDQCPYLLPTLWEMRGARYRRSSLPQTRRCRHAGIENYLALESGGQSLATCIGFPPLCTVGAAELDPPASGRTALFSTAIEFDVFSSPWPEVAAGEVVQLVSGFCPVVAGCAMATPVNEAARTAAAMRSSTQTSGECELVFSKSAGLNVATQ